jgi:hypothetical protein
VRNPPLIANKTNRETWSIGAVGGKEDANALVGVMIEFTRGEFRVGVEHGLVHGYRQDQPVEVLGWKLGIVHVQPPATREFLEPLRLWVPPVGHVLHLCTDDLGFRPGD